MKSEQKKYIIENAEKKSILELSKETGIKERKIKKLLNKIKESKTHFYDEKKISRLEDKKTLQKRMEDDLRSIRDYQITNKLKEFKIITPTSFKEFYEDGFL